MASYESTDHGIRGFQSSTEQDNISATGRTSLQRRVQNVLRWRSWGGEADTTECNGAASQRTSAGSQRHRGQSAGSDVELSALPLTSSFNSIDTPALNSSGLSGVSMDDTLLTGAAFSTNKGSGTSLTSSRPAAAHHALAGQQQSTPQQQPGTATVNNASATADDTCSIATQAGSRAHSFTSLYSMLTEQGEGSEVSGPTAAAAGGSGSMLGAAGAASPYRGSDAGADVATSVSTLPLISESAYDEQQLGEIAELAGEGLDGAQVLGFDEHELQQQQQQPGHGLPHEPATAGALQAGATIQPNAPANGMSGCTSQRVSTSLGGANSVSTVTSGASDASPPAGAPSADAGSTAGSVSSAGPTPAAVLGRMPSPVAGGFARSGYSSQRSTSSSRHSLYHQQQQQQDASHGSSSVDLQPFGSRKRPDNDETCSFATQAGSVHSVSSIMSSAFTDTASTAQRQQQQQQQLFIHPLSEPDNELAGFEEDEQEVEHEGFSDNEVLRELKTSDLDGMSNISTAGVSIISTTAATGGEGYSRLGSMISCPASPSSSNGDMQQQQRGGSRSIAGERKVSLERMGSFKGALRSVIAWGSGLGHKLQRAAGSATHQHSGHKQQQQQHGPRGGGAALSAGVRSGAAPGGQELVSL